VPPPLVLVPAMLCDAELYRAQLPSLGDPLIVPVGEVSMAEAARSVLRQAPPRFALGGTSAGGSLALEIVALAPERIAGLLLSGANPGPSPDPAGARRLSERVRAGEFDAVLDEFAARVVNVEGPRGTVAVATFHRMAGRVGPEAFVRQNEAMITRGDRWGALSALRVPTLLLWGRLDRFSSVDRATEIADRVPGARLVVLQECGHLPTLEHPDASPTAVRDWLRSIDSPAR